MRHSKQKPQKARKFRLLLDAAFAKPYLFPKLVKKANLSHVVHGGGLSPKAADEDIYKLAIEQNRFVLTHDEDFKKIVKPNKPGIFILPAYQSNETIDKFVTKFLSGKNPEDFIGKAIKI